MKFTPAAETWLPIAGFPSYEVSCWGRVRRVVDLALKSARQDKDGYLLIDLYLAGRQYTKRVHQLVAKAFVIGVGAEVDHIDLNRAHNYAHNLQWSDRARNQRNKKPVGKSGILGVRYRIKGNSWQAFASRDNRFISIGHFMTAAEAVTARKEYLKREGL